MATGDVWYTDAAGQYRERFRAIDLGNGQSLRQNPSGPGVRLVQTPTERVIYATAGTVEALDEASYLRMVNDRARDYTRDRRAMANVDTILNSVDTANRTAERSLSTFRRLEETREANATAAARVDAAITRSAAPRGASGTGNS